MKDRAITSATLDFGHRLDGYVGTAYDGDETVVSVYSEWRWLAARRLTKAMRVYVDTGIRTLV